MVPLILGVPEDCSPLHYSKSKLNGSTVSHSSGASCPAAHRFLCLLISSILLCLFCRTSQASSIGHLWQNPRMWRRQQGSSFSSWPFFSCFYFPNISHFSNDNIFPRGQSYCQNVLSPEHWWWPPRALPMTNFPVFQRPKPASRHEGLECIISSCSLLPSFSLHHHHRLWPTVHASGSQLLSRITLQTSLLCRQLYYRGGMRWIENLLLKAGKFLSWTIALPTVMWRDSRW